MKPAWEKLMAEFKDDANRLIADVDCTAAGKELCNQVGVRGYPTIKYGDPNNLEDYKGGRDFDALKAFAAETLGPSCSPANLDLCDAAKKKQIEEFMAMSEADLNTAIAEKDTASTKAEDDLQSMLKGLQAQYEEATKKKDATQTDIKESGMGLMKAVLAHRKNDKNEL